MEPKDLFPVYVSGLFALLGGFVGAWLTRRTEYDKWMRQQRSTEFASLLRRIYEVRIAATNAIYSSEDSEQARIMKATELFAELRQHEHVARLYMSKEGRETLSGLMNSLWRHCTAKGGPAAHGSKIKEVEAAIQALVERELDESPNKWIGWITGRFTRAK